MFNGECQKVREYDKKSVLFAEKTLLELPDLNVCNRANNTNMENIPVISPLKDKIAEKESIIKKPSNMQRT